MSIRSNIILIREINPELKFVPAEIKSSTSFKTEIRRQLEFPFDENYNFSYVLEEGGFFCLQENGDKIISQ